jgi:hypothetical protein
VHFQRSAPGRRPNPGDGVLFADLTGLQLDDPNLIQSFVLKPPDILSGQQAPFAKEFLAPWPEDTAVENAPFRVAEFNIFDAHSEFSKENEKMQQASPAERRTALT